MTGQQLHTTTRTTRYWKLTQPKSLAIGIVMIGLFLLITRLNYRWTRFIHILAGFVWYAMLIFLVVIFLPVMDKFSEQTVYEIIGHIVPRVFHTVSIAGFFAVSVGWYNAYFLSNGRPSYFYNTTIDLIFTASIIMVTMMYFFHLFLESSEINISSRVAAGEIATDSDEYQMLLKGLRITPRVGIVLITIAIVVMFIH